jgi:nucleoside-diphosphate-sugar epimerase
MYRGIAPVLGPSDARFSILYVEDLADAMVKLLEHGNTQQRVFELHDGQPDGYGWEDLTRTMARLRGRRLYQVTVPVRLLKLLAGLNTVVARLAGYAPMLTSGKVSELRHSNWVCDNTHLSRETGWTPHIRLEEGLRRTLKLK